MSEVPTVFSSDLQLFTNEDNFLDPRLEMNSMGT